MNTTTDIILATKRSDGIEPGTYRDENHPNASELNCFLSGALAKVNHRMGGGGAPQGDIFLASIVDLDITELLIKFNLIKWEYPESTQLYLKSQNEKKFTEHTPSTNK